MHIGGYASTLTKRQPSPRMAVSITETAFAGAQTATRVDTFEKASTPAINTANTGDTFHKHTGASNPFVASGVETATVRAPEETFKNLLNDDSPRRRQEAAACFFMYATGIPLGGGQYAQLKENEKAELQALAQNLQLMSARQKVELMQGLTGEQSTPARIAEQVLLQGQPPNMKDVWRMTLPDPQQFQQQGTSTAMRAMGIGLLMLPVLCPATVLFRPELAGQLMAQAALVLL